MKISYSNKSIEILKGDITLQDTDAIVNAANNSLLGGGGVDGAIHIASGFELLEECRALNGCLTGEAKMTRGYDLKAKYIIHTVGPIYGKNSCDAKLLKSAYYNSIKLAAENNLASIAFPAISTGIYRYPLEEAAEIAIMTVLEFLKTDNVIRKVIFVLFNNNNYDIYKEKISRIAYE